MKIRGIYYIDEPKDLTSDAFEVRVLTEPEAGEEGGYEYAFEATTLKYVSERMEEHKGKYFCAGNVAPLLIVQSLDDQTIISAIEDLLPDIDKLGLRME